MKKVLAVMFSLILVSAMLMGCTAVAPAAPATDTSAEAASSESAAVAAPEEPQKALEVVYIPKLIGVSWFDAQEQGLRDYAAEVGGMNITVNGAADTDPVQQAKILEDAIATKPDVIVVVANDAAVLDPICKKAKDAGILVVAQESSGIQNADVDIEFLNIDTVGQQYMDELAKAMGGKGGYAIMVGGLTVENHNLRADAAVKYQKEKYPDMYEVTSRVEGTESVEMAHDKTLELIKAYPDLQGMLYIGTAGPIGAATAVQEKNLQGKFFVVGTASPKEAKPYLDDKSITSVVISNPYNIGYITGFILDQMASGKTVSEITELPIYGTPAIDGKVLTFHSDAIVTPDNWESFGF